MDCKWCRGDHLDDDCRIRRKLQMMEQGATAEEAGFVVVKGEEELVGLLELRGEYLRGGR